MIVNRLTCATLEGVNARVIEVEATFTKGLPGFSVVGLASSDIQESKERTKSALLTNEFVFPPLKITINLSPSDLKKSGTHFDLSLALLIALNKTTITEEGLFVFGELGLDGKVKSSSMLFPLVLSLKEQGVIDCAQRVHSLPFAYIGCGLHRRGDAFRSHRDREEQKLQSQCADFFL